MTKQTVLCGCDIFYSEIQYMAGGDAGTYMNINESEMQFNISKLASAVETSWRGQVEIFRREYSLWKLNEKTHGRNTEDRLRLC